MSINIENNIKFEIGAGLNASLSSNLLLIKGGKETLFSLLDFPFSLTLIKFDSNGLVIQREIVSVTGLTGNVLTITRAFEACPINDSALELSQEPYLFDEGDFAFLTLTAQDLRNIYLAIADKLDLDGGLRIGMIANSIAYFDENGDETLLEYDPVTDLGKSLIISGTGLSLQSPSVNINSLDEKILLNGNDVFILSDSEDSDINKRTSLSNIIDFTKQDFFDKPILYTGSGGDGDLVVSSGTTSLNPNTIYEYNNVTISGGTLTTNGLTDNGSLLILLVSGTFKMTGGTINMNGLGGSGNKLEDIQAQVWYGRSYKDARGSTNGRQDGFPVSVGTYKQLFENVTCGSGGSGANDGYGGQYIMRGGRGGGGVIIIANKIEFTGGTISANGLNGTPDSTLYGAGGPGGGAGGCMFLYSLNKANVDFDNVTITATGGNGISGQIRYGYTNNYPGGGGGSNCNMGGIGGSSGGTNLPSQAGNNGTNGKGFGVALTGGIGGNGGVGLNPQSGYTAPGGGGGGAGGDFYFYL